MVFLHEVFRLAEISRVRVEATRFCPIGSSRRGSRRYASSCRWLLSGANPLPHSSPIEQLFFSQPGFTSLGKPAGWVDSLRAPLVSRWSTSIPIMGSADPFPPFRSLAAGFFLPFVFQDVWLLDLELEYIYIYILYIFYLYPSAQAQKSTSGR